MTANLHTEPTQWRLDIKEGAHHWRYVDAIEAKERPQSAAERYFLGLSTVGAIPVEMSNR